MLKGGGAKPRDAQDHWDRKAALPAHTFPPHQKKLGMLSPKRTPRKVTMFRGFGRLWARGGLGRYPVVCAGEEAEVRFRYRAILAGGMILASFEDPSPPAEPGAPTQRSRRGLRRR